MYYSQFGQDRYLSSFFEGKSDGSFIEIGALDGVKFSNSLFFENSGWSTFLCEANPNNYESIVENRPNSKEITLKAVVPNDYLEDTIKFLSFEPGYGDGLSGIVGEYEEDHLSRIEREISKGLISTSPKEVSCEVVKIYDLLENYSLLNGSNHFDIMSLDIEGMEEKIIKSIDYNKFSFGFIMVENNYKKNTIERFLSTVGYEKVANIKTDEIFRNKGKVI